MSRASRRRSKSRKPGDGPHHILVVDDEPDLERLVRVRLRREVRSGRFVLSFARDGVEALEMLGGNGKIDIVLSDINMPRMDGLTLLSQIPSVDPDVRAVIVSAYGDMKNIRTAMNMGAFDFLTKPIDFADLRSTVDRSLRNLMVWRKALRARNRLVTIENELELARRMQLSIVPRAFPKSPEFDVHGTMYAAKAVGGDFFDVTLLENGRVGLTIADVSGKGVPAALFMMSSRILVKGAVIGHRDPDTVVAYVNEALALENAALMFVTLLYTVFDPSSGELSYCCGGHDPPLVVHPDGSSTSLPHTGGMVLGVFGDADYTCSTVQLSPGDTVVLFTDGVTEAQNVAGEQFGMGRLKQLFSDLPPSSAEYATASVVRVVEEFKGAADQFDDLTCAALKFTGAKP